MYARFDFVSPTTGRVLLSTLLDSPPDALDGKKVVSMLAELGRTKKALESLFGKGQVRLSLESYESSVFWYLVLFRPIHFSNRHPKFCGRRLSVYDVLLDGGGTDLQKTNLGVVYDRENGWLSLLWDEAFAEEGVCAGIETCPSWAAILAEYKKRMGVDAPREWQKQVAQHHSWVIDEWRLHKMAYKTEKLWFRPNVLYDHITVLNLVGLEVIRLEGIGKGLLNEATLLAPRRVRYLHHYTLADKREFKAMRLLQEKLSHAKKMTEEARAAQSKQQREARAYKRNRAHTNWMIASRTVGELCREFGVGKSGRYPREMRGNDCLARYRRVLDRYVNGQLASGASQTARVKKLLADLTDLLADTQIPAQFQIWLNFRYPLEIALDLDQKGREGT